MFPKSSQLDAKTAQESPTCRQDCPKYSPRPSNQTPKTPKCSQNAVVLFVFTLQPFFERSTPGPQKIFKIAFQMASRWPSWFQLGPSWRQLGAILTHLGEIFVDLGLAKIGEDRFLQIVHARGTPKKSRTPSRPRFSWLLGSMLDGFSFRFCSRCLLRTSSSVCFHTHCCQTATNIFYASSAPYVC